MAKRRLISLRAAQATRRVYHMILIVIEAVGTRHHDGTRGKLSTSIVRFSTIASPARARGLSALTNIHLKVK